MKLTYVVNEIKGTTGLERMVAVQTDYFIRYYNYDIEIVLLDQNETKSKPFFEFNNKIRIHYNDLNYKGLKRLTNNIKRLNFVLNAVNPDIVIVCIDDVFGLFLPCFLKSGFKTIYQRHSTNTINYNRLSNSFTTKIFNRIKKHVISFGGKGYDNFVVLSDEHKLDWKHLRNLKVVANPIIIDTNEQQAVLKNKIVLAVGRHDPVKGFDMLLRSWIKVSNKHPNWKLKIIGEKTTSVDLHKISRDLNLCDSVIFDDFTKDMSSLYLESSILVCSSIMEGFPLVVIEAMSFGVPVVSFDCPYGPRAIINDDKDGILVPPNDTDLLASSIIHLIENDNIRASFGRNAKQNIQRLSKHNIMPRWKSLFENLI